MDYRRAHRSTRLIITGTGVLEAENTQDSKMSGLASVRHCDVADSHRRHVARQFISLMNITQLMSVEEKELKVPNMKKHKERYELEVATSSQSIEACARG